MKMKAIFVMIALHVKMMKKMEKFKMKKDLDIEEEKENYGNWKLKRRSG